MGAVAKSDMRKCAKSKSYMRRPLVIYDFSTAPFLIFLYMRKIVLFFQCRVENQLIPRGPGSGFEPQSKTLLEV